MKRIPQRLSYKLGPIHLYLDEIEKIIEHLRSGAETVDVDAGEFHLEPTDKLADIKGAEIHDLTIESSNPHIAVQLWPRSAELIAYRDDPNTRGLFEVIKDELITHQRLFSGFHRYPMAGGVTLGLSPSVLLFLPIPTAQRLIATALMFALGVLMSLPVLRILHKSYSTVVLRYRAERPSFWQRKGDEILIALISAIIGSLLTLGITKLFG